MKINVTQELNFGMEIVENIMGKGENAVEQNMIPW